MRIRREQAGEPHLDMMAGPWKEGRLRTEYLRSNARAGESSLFRGQVHQIQRKAVQQELGIAWWW